LYLYYRALQPGGYIELQELRFVTRCDDDTVPPDYHYGRFINLCIDGFKHFGVNPLSMEKNPDLLQADGFENIREKV
jgi:hypothetical protein